MGNVDLAAGTAATLCIGDSVAVAGDASEFGHNRTGSHHLTPVFQVMYIIKYLVRHGVGAGALRQWVIAGLQVCAAKL